MSDATDEYLAVESAGSVAGISPRTLRYWIKGGKLPAVAGPKGKLVRLSDVLAIAELTGKLPAPDRQPAGNPAAAGSAEPVAGDAAGSDAVAVAARAQLEAIRDERLQPLVDQLKEQAATIGRLEAERDALQAENDRPRAPHDPRTATTTGQGAAVAESRGAEPSAESAPQRPTRRARWRVWGR